MPPRLKRCLGILGCVLATFYSASQLFVLLTMLTAAMQPATPSGSGVQVNGYPLPVQVLLLALGCAAIVACARLAAPRPAPAPASASTDAPAVTDSAAATLAALWMQPTGPTTEPTPVERSEVAAQAEAESTVGKNSEPPAESTVGKNSEPTGTSGTSGSTGTSGAGSGG